MPQSRGERYRETGIVGETKNLLRWHLPRFSRPAYSPDFRHFRAEPACLLGRLWSLGLCNW